MLGVVLSLRISEHDSATFVIQFQHYKPMQQFIDAPYHRDPYVAGHHDSRKHTDVFAVVHEVSRKLQMDREKGRL